MELKLIVWICVIAVIALTLFCMKKNGEDPLIGLCWLGLHKWAKWLPHPHRGDWITRVCTRCYKLQDRRD